MLDVFSYHFSKHACLTGGFRVIGKKKVVVSLLFAWFVVLTFFIFLLSFYIYLGGCLIKFCLANFRCHLFLFSFFLHLFRIAC